MSSCFAIEIDCLFFIKYYFFKNLNSFNIADRKLARLKTYSNDLLLFRSFNLFKSILN